MGGILIKCKYAASLSTPVVVYEREQMLVVELFLLGQGIQHGFELVVTLGVGLLHQHQLVELSVAENCAAVGEHLVAGLTFGDEQLEVGFVHH